MLLENIEPLALDHIDVVQSWIAEQGEDANLYLGVDTGATNTRIALASDTSSVIIVRFLCNSTRVLLFRLQDLQDQLTALGLAKHIRAGCIGAAGRVMHFGSQVEITNYIDDDNQIHKHLKLSELPTGIFPPGKSRILNDLEIACHGIAALSAQNALDKYFQILAGPHLDSPPGSLSFENHLVFAIGTGMGVGLLVASEGLTSFVVLPLEGGHIQVSPFAKTNPLRSEEADLFGNISDKLYQGNHALEYEDLASGRGLVKLYEWVASAHPEVPETLTAHQISERAHSGCPHASKALLYHYVYLARGSANMAVAMQAKSIFWAGGNQVTNKDFVKEHADELYKEFLSHPKRDWIASVPIFSQVEPCNINLEGAFHVCRHTLAPETKVVAVK